VVRPGPCRCLGAEEALGVVRLLYYDTLRVRLCQLGPTSPRPWRLRESFVFLCHAPNMTLSGEQLAGPCLGSGAGEPPEHR
jgi:hypothetical protein